MFAGLFFSCKKSNTSKNCNIIALSDSTSSIQSITQFTYDNSNRLITIEVSGENACKKTLQYYGNTIIFSVTDTTPGIMHEIDTLVLNNSGLIQTQYSHFPSSGASSIETFFYDSTGKTAISSIESDNGVPGDTMEYSTVNGDLIYEKSQGQTTDKYDFTYYTSENIIYGDPTDFRQLLYYGAYYYKNKHMLDVLYSPGNSYKRYTYTFSNNRLSEAVLRLWVAGSTDTVTHFLSYSYSCN